MNQQLHVQHRAHMVNGAPRRRRPGPAPDRQLAESALGADRAIPGPEVLAVEGGEGTPS